MQFASKHVLRLELKLSQEGNAHYVAAAGRNLKTVQVLLRKEGVLEILTPNAFSDSRRLVALPIGALYALCLDGVFVFYEASCEVKALLKLEFVLRRIDYLMIVLQVDGDYLLL